MTHLSWTTAKEVLLLRPLSILFVDNYPGFVYSARPVLNNIGHLQHRSYKGRYGFLVEPVKWVNFLYCAAHSEASIFEVPMNIICSLC